jgi:diketogulonate reductase-like aldo/keto reductase
MKRTHEIEQDESTSKKIKVENPILHPPKLLFGTYKLSKTSCPAAIRAAFHPTPSATLSSSSSSSTSTYLGIDCAPIYNNEQSVGKALTSALNAANISRSNIWIQSKLWRSVTPSKVHTAIRKSIKGTFRVIILT